MSTFHLQIITPDGVLFDDQAERMIVKTTEGDVGILPNHIDYFSAIGIGPLKVTTKDGVRRTAAVSGGFVNVSRNEVRVMAISCEWADQIDLSRAERARDLAEEAIRDAKDRKKLLVTELKLRRALNRIHVRQNYTE